MCRVHIIFQSLCFCLIDTYKEAITTKGFFIVKLKLFFKSFLDDIMFHKVCVAYVEGYVSFITLSRHSFSPRLWLVKEYALFLDIYCSRGTRLAPLVVQKKPTIMRLTLILWWGWWDSCRSIFCFGFKVYNCKPFRVFFYFPICCPSLSNDDYWYRLAIFLFFLTLIYKSFIS